MLHRIIAFAILATFFSCKGKATKNTAEVKNDSTKKWWKEATVYQIYPRSFKDSDGDGIGDLKGLTGKLDYVKSLGIDIVWLNPIYGSPNADNGYDISNYDDIMKEFGTMTDFDTMLAEMHKRGLKLVMDLVVNHCSDEHEWFKQSRSSRTNKYRNYFHWWPAERGKPAFRPGSFEVDGSGWRFDTLTNSYYLHYFSYKQPDLNWENPELRKEIYAMMNRWFKKGVDGFRMDVIPVIAKDTAFPVITQKDLDEKYGGGWFTYFASTPAVHTYLQEMNKEVLSKYDIMTLAEGAGTTKATAMNFVDPDRHELDMSYHFEGVDIGYEKGAYKKMNPNWSLLEFKNVYSAWDSVFANKGWGTIYLGNHDQPRMVTRWGNDAPEFREASSKMLTTFLLSMRGTPYYYYGDELGMTNIKFDKIEDYRDIEMMAEYGKVKNAGGDLKAFLETQKNGGARDNGRTPMQWDSGANAGFTTGIPWLKVNENKSEINVAAAEVNPNSTLSYFKKMIKLRKEHKDILVYGKYTLLDRDNPNVYAYTREADGKKVLVLLNFKKTISAFKLNGLTITDEWINNLQPLKTVDGTVNLQPYQACIVNLK
ncbi:MAG: alpha-glucosidase [Ferruginibacter sp.]|nr:alpha-glucosidase [Ferruginibacter sp.]